MREVGMEGGVSYCVATLVSSMVFPESRHVQNVWVTKTSTVVYNHIH